MVEPGALVTILASSVRWRVGLRQPAVTLSLLLGLWNPSLPRRWTRPPLVAELEAPCHLGLPCSTKRGSVFRYWP